MTTRTCIFVGVMCLALGLAGCQEPQRPKPGVIVGEETLPIEHVAVRLGLRIEQRDETFVVLRNAGNTVIVFTHADGRFFVNGKPIGSVGLVKQAGDTVYVPVGLVDQIRPHLQTAVATPPPAVTPRRTTGLVVIDAGHGGHDPGAISPTGIQEKDINLRVAAKIANLLESRGVGVVMTRWQDRFIELEDRSGIANQRKADLFVSIHADSAPNRSAQGFTVYVATAASAGSYRAAHAINRAMEKTGMNNRGVREAGFQVLVNTRVPAVLIELGYLTNPQDAARLTDDHFRDRLAQAIVEGIQAYLR
jgi:N-acetylmuramoyl-L-alanine amidase